MPSPGYAGLCAGKNKMFADWMWSMVSHSGLIVPCGDPDGMGNVHVSHAISLKKNMQVWLWCRGGGALPIVASPHTRHKIISPWVKMRSSCLYNSYGHTRAKAPHPVRSGKVNACWPSQYCRRRLGGNTRCCSFFFFFRFPFALSNRRGIGHGTSGCRVISPVVILHCDSFVVTFCLYPSYM